MEVSAVQSEALVSRARYKRAEDAKTFFKRKRTWAFDPSIVPCDGGNLTKDPLSAYPSGHSLTGYSLGLALASGRDLNGDGWEDLCRMPIANGDQAVGR